MSFLKSLLSSAPPGRITFADIGWGESAASATRKLVAAGYAIDATDDGDIAFHGRFASYPATGWLWVGLGKVQKVSLTVTPGEADLLGALERVRGQLIQRLGPTPHMVEIFEKPFAKGDGKIFDAIRANKVILGGFWREQEDNIHVGCVLRVLPELTIKIAFEGPGWQAEIKRRDALTRT